MAEMIQADKSMVQLERKLKRKSADLEMDVKIAKAKEMCWFIKIIKLDYLVLCLIQVKQSFDIGLRKFRAFISDWNESKSLVLMQQFSQEFIRKSTRTIDSVRHLLQTELGNEQEALEILEKVSSEINENNVIRQKAAFLIALSASDTSHTSQDAGTINDVYNLIFVYMCVHTSAVNG